MVNDGSGIICPYDAAGCLLDREWGLPWLIDILAGILLELGKILLDVITLLVGLLPESHWTVHSEKLVKESASRKPHPVSGIETPISVKEILFKNFLSLFPGLPEVAPCQETGH